MNIYVYIYRSFPHMMDNFGTLHIYITFINYIYIPIYIYR